MKVFTSKIDAWILIVFITTILVPIFAAFFSTKKGGVLSIISAFLLLAVGAILPIWLLLTTKYVVAEEQLIVNSGPFTWTIPTASISSVKETRNSRASPALTLDRLQLNYGEGKSIMLSPKDKIKFKHAIGH
jgi:hypothetical protein